MEKEKNEVLESLYKSIQTFDSLTIEAESRDKMYRYHDAFMQSLFSILNDSEHSDDEKLAYFESTCNQYVDALSELFPRLIQYRVQDSMKAVGKSDPNRFVEIVEVEKFNPYHDERGRFATADGYASFTTRTKDPSKQHMADAAVAREKERNAKEEESKKPKRVEFTPAKTKKEAVEYAQTELGFSKVSYGTKLDIDTINHINEEIANIQAAQPMVKGAVQELSTTTANCYAQVALSPDGTMRFQVSSKAYGSGLESLKQSYARDVESGFHPAGTDYKSIIYHEYGHVMAAISSKNKVGVGAHERVNSWDGRTEYISSLRGHTTEKAWLFSAAKKTGQKPSELMKSVSRYAQKNPAETFAEAYAEFMCSASPRAEAVAIVTASGWDK